MLTDFYGSFASISFTILGLWFVVAQTRLRVEAIMLSLLVFLGVTLAWLLMFEPGDEPEPAAAVE